MGPFCCSVLHLYSLFGGPVEVEQLFQESDLAHCAYNTGHSADEREYQHRPVKRLFSFWHSQLGERNRLRLDDRLRALVQGRAKPRQRARPASSPVEDSIPFRSPMCDDPASAQSAPGIVPARTAADLADAALRLANE